MFLRSKPLRLSLLGLVPVLALSACGSSPADAAADCTGLPDTPVLSFAAYSTPREVYGKIIPAFRDQWKEDHDGQDVIFQESYGASTSQAANVIAGYEADIVALSLGPDVDQIADAGLITHDWTDAPDGGMVSTSVVVFDVRPGNPTRDRGLGRPRDPRRRGAHPGPRFERRCALEPRVRLGCGPPRPRGRDRGR